ncbi:MAG: hypothetical protein ACI3YD_05715 [Alloprevotella sp.]
MEAIESIAHTLRGATTVFFFAWAVVLYRLRHSSRLMQLLHCLSLLLGFEYLKDAIFLFPQFQSDPFWDDLVSLADLLCVPIACACCVELVRPGTATSLRIIPPLLLQLLSIVCYAVWPLRVIFYTAFATAFLQVTATVSWSMMSLLRNRQCTPILTPPWEQDF